MAPVCLTAQTINPLKFDIEKYTPTSEVVDQYERKWGDWTRRNLITKSLIFKSQLQEMIERATQLEISVNALTDTIRILRIDIGDAARELKAVVKLYRLKIFRAIAVSGGVGVIVGVVAIILVRMAISGRFD